MKKSTLLLIMMLCITSFGYSQPKQNASKPKLEVLYFHATNRCATCNAIENNALKVLGKDFKSQIENGTIKFSSYNVDESVNKALVDKYKISFSTLLLVKSDGTKTDFTNNAFQYALSNPVKYGELLKAAVEKNLK